MPRDYAKKTTRTKNKHSLPGWAWMLAGLSIGLFVAFLVYLNEHTPASKKTAFTDAVSKIINEKKKSSKEKPKSKKSDTKKKKDEKPRPRFDFYTILPELEVAIPEQDLLPSKIKTMDLGKKGNYVLQAGSFRHSEEADRLKAKLALLGIEANIQTVTINNGDTWHRVRVGPMQDITLLNRTRRRLQKNGVPSIVLKIKE